MEEKGEIRGILEEINEELKHDQLMSFLNKHRNIVFSIVCAVVIGIFIHSSWYSRKKQHMEEISSALVNIIQNFNTKDDLMLSGLMEDAPSELKPILSIIKSGKKLRGGESLKENLDDLLALSQKNGVDLIWKDLSTLIYASYRPKSSDDLVKLLEPLTSDDRPFRFSALEMIGLIYETDGKNDNALKCFKKIMSHPEAPNTIKDRISILHNYIKNRTENSEKTHK